MIESSQLVSSCRRCRGKFAGKEAYCLECVRNPLLDRVEDRMLSKHDPSEIFQFMGWRFKVRELPISLSSEIGTILTCYKRIFNPVGGEISVAYFPGRKENISEMKRSASWLIAHWWEHYMNICPCLQGGNDHDEDSIFQKAMSDSLLWYDANL